MHAPWAARGKLYLISRLPPQVERDHSLNMQKRSFNYELTSNIFRENFLWVHLSWQTAFNITLPFHFSSSFLPLPPLFCFILLLYSSLNTTFFGGIQGDISENKNQFLKGKKNPKKQTQPSPLCCLPWQCRLNRLLNVCQHWVSGGIGVAKAWRVHSTTTADEGSRTDFNSSQWGAGRHCRLSRRICLFSKCSRWFRQQYLSACHGLKISHMIDHWFWHVTRHR